MKPALSSLWCFSPQSANLMSLQRNLLSLYSKYKKNKIQRQYWEFFFCALLHNQNDQQFLLIYRNVFVPTMKDTEMLLFNGIIYTKKIMSIFCYSFQQFIL